MSSINRIFLHNNSLQDELPLTLLIDITDPYKTIVSLIVEKNKIKEFKVELNTEENKYRSNYCLFRQYFVNEKLNHSLE